MNTKRMVAHYEMRELLGEGGIGQVHAAYDTVLGREVAIKSLRPELLNDGSFVDRFRTEATSLARLNHPNITTLYALLPEGGNLYMVMELVRGRTLEALLHERGSAFEVGEALAIIGQAADGMSYAHGMGVIHRDIKPGNMILTDSGLLKIMDFGIARVQGSQRLTRDGSIVGTLAYMAPEQLRAEEVDARTDLYSLAIVLYEMLSGSVPFAAASDYDLMRAQIHTPPERLTHRVPGIEAQLDKALMRALAKKPADRYPSVADFKQALGNSVSRTEAVGIAQKVTRFANVASFPEPVRAAVTTLSEPARKFSPALRGIAIGTAAAIVVAAAAVLLLGPRVQLPLASPPPAPAAASAQASQPAAKTGSASTAGSTAAATPSPAWSQTLFPSTRQGGPPGAAPAPAAAGTTTPAKSESNRPPFGVAAEPATSRPAARVAEANVPPPAAVPSETKRSAEQRPAPIAEPRSPAAATEQRLAAPSAEPRGPATPEPRAGEPTASEQRLVAQGSPDQRPSVAATSEQRMAAPAAAPAPSEEPAGGSTTAAVQPSAEPAPQAPQPESVAPAPAGTAAVPAAPAGGATPAPAVRPRATFAEVRAAYDLKDFPRTRELAEPLAQSGDQDAQFIMARLYHIGGGTKKDEEKAIEWYQKAAEQGHSRAQYNLAVMYENGEGVLVNKRVAAEWYRKAAVRGISEAQYNLGKMYALGLGVEQDGQQARRWLGEAAASTDPDVSNLAQAALDQMSGGGESRRRRRR